MHLGSAVFLISRRAKDRASLSQHPDISCWIFKVYREAVPPFGLFVPHKAVTLFASPPSSSWQLFCLLLPLPFIALKLHCDQQQRIQPLPFVWLACESATESSQPRKPKAQAKAAAHCQSG
jgi:hypothetical protein